ncbi:MAG: ABC-F family ATP-binding cassette domain-containing protein [Bacteriovoracaceae bacterium]
MIQIQNLSKSFGDRVLFENVTFSLSGGEIMGLVGRNGCGKSTLLKIIAEKDSSDSGEIIKPKNYEIGMLDQHLKFSEKTIALECAKVLPANQKEDLYRVEKILMGLGFCTDDFEKSPGEFSGGYQIRLNLAKLLLKAPNLLLLDEPTNYLDIVSLRWLERFLKSYDGEVLLITHDRSFMDQTVESVGGFFYRKLRKVKGNTKKLYEFVEIERENLKQTKKNQEKKIKQLQDFADKYRAKARKASQAQSKLKQIEKMDVIEIDRDDEVINFHFRYHECPGKMLLTAKNLSYRYSEQTNNLFENLDFSLRPGECVGIIGANGSGKSTLMNLIAGELKNDQSELNFHNQVRINHFGQTNVNRLDLGNSILDEISLANDDLGTTELRSICGTMFFSGDDAYKKINVLSGGERSRVLLGKLLARPCNILLLDEPSNHLDIESVKAFTEEVRRFAGGVVIISHDEWILRELCQKFIVFKDGKAFEFLGTYDDFMKKVGWDDQDSMSQRQNESQMIEEAPEKNHMRREERKALKREHKKLAKHSEQLEEQISCLEEEIKKIEKALMDGSARDESSDILKQTNLWEELKAKVDELYIDYDKTMENLEELEGQIE